MIVFGAGVWWIRESVRHQWMSRELDAATAKAAIITNALATSDQPLRGVDGDFLVVDAKGSWVNIGFSGDTGMVGWISVDDTPGLFPPAIGWHTRTVPMPERFDKEFAGRTVTFAVGTTKVLSAEQISRSSGTGVRYPQRLTVYVLASPKNADAAVATIDRVFGWGLLVAVPFVALIAWLAAGRALRPVEAIRSKMARIGAEALDQRVPVPSSGDEITRLALTTNETLDRLEKSVRRQAEFVTNASHELRSPLANLRNALEVPLTHPTDVDWPVIVADALADTTRLQRLTDDLLLLAATGRRTPAPGETTDLSDLVNEQVGERSYLPGETPRFVAETIPGALVPGTELQVGRIVRNLLDNAAKHATTRVTVIMKGEEATVLLTVADDGPGVPAADRERIFDRFVRLDDARTRATGGSGLGLTIARGLAEELGGTVTADDEGFHLRLPHAPE